ITAATCQPDSLKLPTPPDTTSSSAHTRGSAQATTLLSESASKNTTAPNESKPSSFTTATGTTTKANHDATQPCDHYCKTERPHDETLPQQTLQTQTQIRTRRHHPLRRIPVRRLLRQSNTPPQLPRLGRRRLHRRILWRTNRNRRTTTREGLPKNHRRQPRNPRAPQRWRHDAPHVRLWQAPIPALVPKHPTRPARRRTRTPNKQTRIKQTPSPQRAFCGLLYLSSF